MHARLRRGLSLLAVAALTAAGCETTTLPPEPGGPPSIMVPFSGTLTLNGAATHRFPATLAGEINVRLKTLSPESTVTIGLSLGVWTGASCNIVIADDNAILNALLIGSANAAGEFCARVYDVGKLTAATDYLIEVTHF